MAERERLTNKERRAQGREERKRREAEAAKQRKKSQLRNGLITFGIVAIVGAVVIQAVTGGPATIDDPILLSTTEADDAFEAAGCEVLVDREPLPDRSHVENTAQVDPDVIYPEIRPTHSGPHTVGVHPVTAAASRQIDEVSTTHNLEHGSIIVWYDPDEVQGGPIGDWAETLNANGFRRDVGGIGILTSPYTDPGISSGKNVALRAWGTAWDCDAWDETVANSFVIENFGTHGIGPERMAAPYPTGVLDFSDREVEDSDAPVDGQMAPEEIEEVDPDERDEVVEENEADAGDAGDDAGDVGTDDAEADAEG